MTSELPRESGRLVIRRGGGPPALVSPHGIRASTLNAVPYRQPSPRTSSRLRRHLVSFMSRCMRFDQVESFNMAGGSLRRMLVALRHHVRSLGWSQSAPRAPPSLVDSVASASSRVSAVGASVKKYDESVLLITKRVSGRRVGPSRLTPWPHAA